VTAPAVTKVSMSEVVEGSLSEHDLAWEMANAIRVDWDGDTLMHHYDQVAVIYSGESEICAWLHGETDGRNWQAKVTFRLDSVMRCGYAEHGAEEAWRAVYSVHRFEGMKKDDGGIWDV